MKDIRMFIRGLAPLAVALVVALVSLPATALAAEDPTKDEKDFYDAIKKRFNGNKELATPKPADPKDARIDVSEILDAEGKEKLIATKDCPKDSAVTKVEIYITFRLVHFTAGGSEAGAFKIEKFESKTDKGVKKLTYRYGVSFDVEAGKKMEADAIGKWWNAGLFYHEMMHGQLTINRVKDPKWEGLAAACKCDTPNLEFIGKGVNTGAEEHKKINPAEDQYLKAAVAAKEDQQLTVVRTDGVAGEKDKDGNRPFKIEIPIPDAIREKEKIGTRTFWSGAIVGEPTVTIDPDRGKVTIEGKVKDDGSAAIFVVFDPRGIAAVAEVRVSGPVASATPTATLGGPPPVQTERRFGLVAWLLGIVLLALFFTVLLRRRR